MMNSTTVKSLSAGGFLALAIAAYVFVSPNEGMLSGPSTVSLLLHSLPLVSF